MNEEDEKRRNVICYLKYLKRYIVIIKWWYNSVYAQWLRGKHWFWFIYQNKRNKSDRLLCIVI